MAMRKMTMRKMKTKIVINCRMQVSRILGLYVQIVRICLVVVVFIQVCLNFVKRSILCVCGSMPNQIREWL